MQRTVKTIGFIIFLIALTAAMNLPIQAQSGAGTHDGWAWTRKNLNPTWMEWGEKYWPTKPVSGGVYRIASSVYIGLMNPNHWPVMDWNAINLFYEGITAFDGQYNQRVGWLMESFEFTSPTTLIMKLQQGVKFHDGTDYNARSLKYLFDWIGDKKNGCWTRGQQKRIKSLEVVDDYTLLWTTKKPWGSFPQGFFGYQISAKALKGDIALREAQKAKRQLKTAQKKYKKAQKAANKLSGHTGEAVKKAEVKLQKAKRQLAEIEDLAQRLAEETKDLKSTDVHPVGTGPFILEKASPGNHLQLKRNPNWWFGQSIGRPEMPYFDGIKVVVIPDPSIQLANLRAGKIHTMTLSKALYTTVKNDPGINVVSYPSNSTSTLNFNQKGSPCADLRVRKAISHAIDRKALLAGTQFGMARIASCMYPGDHWAHNPDLKPVSYDPELSKRLLAEAGYANGLTLRGINYNSLSSVNLGTAVKHMLAKVGIDWQVEVLDAAANSDRSRNLEYDLAVSALPEIQDPDSHLTWFYHPQGGIHHNGRNHNQRLIDLIEAGRLETDLKKRQQVYFSIEEELYLSLIHI